MEDDISSIKHHYLPEFYLKGFTNSDQKLYVYDKRYKRLYTKPTSAIFYEKHRNTGKMIHPETGEEHRSDMAEGMLASFDSDMANVLENVRRSKPEDNIMSDAVMLYELRMLTQSIFWRSPAQDRLLNQVIDELSFEDLGFGVFDSKGNRYVEWEELFKTVDLWRKFYPGLLMVASFRNRYKKANNSDWRLYYLPDQYHITSDNPLVLSEWNDLSSLQGELLFPVSRDILLVSSQKYKPHILPSLFSAKVDLLIFHQATRFVAGPSEEYLRFVVKEVEGHSTMVRWDEMLREDLFKYFY
jgi:hypothetical protein